MGMSIDEAIKEIESITVVVDENQALAFALAVHAMKKYQMMQADYKARLKADMMAMLEELDLMIDEIPIVTRHGMTGTVMTAQGMRKKIKENIQKKINALKENKDAI